MKSRKLFSEQKACKGFRKIEVLKMCSFSFDKLEIFSFDKLEIFTYDKLESIREKLGDVAKIHSPHILKGQNYHIFWSSSAPLSSSSSVSSFRAWQEFSKILLRISFVFSRSILRNDFRLRRETVRKKFSSQKLK